MKGSGVPSPVNYIPGQGDDPPASANVDGKPATTTAGSGRAQQVGRVAGRGAPPLQPETYEKIIALGPLPYEIADGIRAGFDKLFGPTGRLFSKGVKIWEDGVPMRVAKSMYELAVAGEPLVLANKAVELIIKASRGNGGSGEPGASF